MRSAATLASLLLVVTGCSSAEDTAAPSSSPQPETRTATASPDATSDPGSKPGEPSSEPGETGAPRVVATIATGLSVPWGITFLPDGTALVSERDTTRVVAVENRKVRSVGELSAAEPEGEAGLLGLAASPDFVRDHLVYAYLSTSEDNRVVAMTFDGDELGAPEAILTGIPNGFIHDGGRLQFGPDGYLYVSTGETGEEQLAQDTASLGGKILRITTEGEPAPGNPDEESPIWTLGHRNVQGLAFDQRDRLWATEFGDSTWDELNLIERGRNYGWPLVEGRGDLAEYRNPFVQWQTSEASPSGLAFLDGSLWAASLRGQRLWQVPVKSDGLGEPRGFFVGSYGRLRTVVAAPDGNLWVTTSNRDGRGEPGPKDDQILLVATR